jgi:hypothetical protein
MMDVMRDYTICPDCGKHYEVGDWPYPCAGLGHELGSFWIGDAAIHSSEKVVVYERDGQIRIPGRGDRPMHPKYAAEGWERKVLDSIADVRRVEKQTGLIHEQSNYDRNSAAADRDTNSK